MQLPLEAVPNFSEGRDHAVVDAIGRALAERASCSTSTPTRITTAPSSRSSATTTAARRGAARRDRRRARADRPAARTTARIRGSARPTSCRSCRCGPTTWSGRARRRSSSRAGSATSSELPVFLYGELAPGRGPAFFRRGGPDGAAAADRRRRASCPDFGPDRLDPSAGGVIVGARRPLIAFNVNLVGTDVEAARAIARVVRERDGGFPGVRALGLVLPARRARAGEHERRGLGGGAARTRSSRRSSARPQRAASRSPASELVGLMPAGAAAAAAGAALRIDGFDASRVLELRLLDR